MKEKLLKMRERVSAQLHAAQGALQVIDALLADPAEMTAESAPAGHMTAESMTEQELADAIERGANEP